MMNLLSIHLDGSHLFRIKSYRHDPLSLLEETQVTYSLHLPHTVKRLVVIISEPSVERELCVSMQY